MVTDLELLDAWAAGDKKAAKALIDRHCNSLFRFFRNKVGDGVEDLVQETLLACVQARDRFRREASFRTFLFATARYVLLGHFKRQRRVGPPVDFDAVSVLDLGPSPSSVALKKAEHRILLEALRRIPIEQQIVLELYHWEDLTAVQLGEVLELSEAATRSRLHRAKVELRRQVEAIAESAELLESTCTNLDDWARSLRELLDGPK